MKFLTPGVPFLSRMGWVFVMSVVLIVVLSWLENKGKDSEKAISLSGIKLGGDPVFTLASFGILGITAALYAMFW
jgi:SSS family solute:Na+ symporter